MELPPQASLQLIDRALPEVAKFLFAVRVEAMPNHGISSIKCFGHAGSDIVTGVRQIEPD